MRIREWWDLHGQLKQMCRDLDLHTSSDRAGDDAIHQSLLAGLLSHVGLFEEKNRDYQGARGTRFVLWPGSAIAKKRPDYVMAAELVETSRLFGRTAARIRPEWIEELGAHVVKRSYSEPHWSTKRAAAMAYEKVTLYGVPIIAQRAVNLGRIDREQARDTFIQQALIEGRWTTRHHFFRDNNRLIEDLQELEAKTRRRDIIAGDETLFRFYDERLPQNIVSGRHFDSWWKKQRHKTPDLLHFTRDLLLADDAEPAAQGFPDTWVQGDITLHLTYNFDPTTQRDAKQKQRDGVTATVPLAVLGRLEDTGFDWLVPGMREELIIELIRSPTPAKSSSRPSPMNWSRCRASPTTWSCTDRSSRPTASASTCACTSGWSTRRAAPSAPATTSRSSSSASPAVSALPRRSRPTASARAASLRSPTRRSPPPAGPARAPWTWWCTPRSSSAPRPTGPSASI